ncbi:putative nuclease HARBI1 isoform X2 [Sitophilus oryzae]|nr:putative nuclease HARBI1 isoform X2 [Sitophilus oryzae]XP_030752552.1 putative nuclease HARBI1 isoform X2 [Sitophilus oryzae]
MRNQPKKHAKIENYILSVVPRYCDMDFKSHFRLTRTVVEKVLEDLQLQPIKLNITKPSVSPEHAFLLTLWVLANQESFRGIADRFGLSRGHAHTIFIQTVKRMYAARDRYIIWPQNAVSLRRKILDFNNLRGNLSFPNVVGCVDGSHILINGPRGDDSYYNRKGTHSMLIQGICDSEMLFTDIYCGWPGSTHDSRMWKESPIYEKLKTNLLGEEFHLLGDTAYPLETFIMVPYKDNGHLTKKQKKFNQILSSTRVVIEQAFGRLKGIWRRLKFLNIQNLSYFKFIIIATCMLHNILIRENIDQVENLEAEEEFIEQDIDSVPLENIVINARAKQKREQLTVQLEHF